MLKTILIATALLATTLSWNARADHLTTGNELLQHCVSAPDKFCAGYIGGVLDTSHTLFCVPPDVKKRDIINIVIVYLHDHPKILGLYAPNLVIDAMRSAFPCKEGRM